MRTKPQIIADEKEKFFNSMLAENNLEGVKWIAKLVEIELKLEHLEKAMANRQWEIANWLIEKKPQFLSQTDFTEILETMRSQKKPGRNTVDFQLKGKKRNSRAFRRDD